MGVVKRGQKGNAASLEFLKFGIRFYQTIGYIGALHGYGIARGNPLIVCSRKRDIVKSQYLWSGMSRTSRMGGKGEAGEARGAWKTLGAGGTRERDEKDKQGKRGVWEQA